MFTLDNPADTFNFMLFGFTVILGSIGLFVISLSIRTRNLKRDLELLDQIDADEAN